MCRAGEVTKLHPAVTGGATAARIPGALILLLVLLLVASLLPTTAGASEGRGQPFPPLEDRVPDYVLVRFHVPAADMG